MKIYCKNIEQYVEIQGGASLLDISRGLNLGFEPICAKVNNKSESLYYPVYAPKQVEYMPAASDSGVRTYVRSLCMVLYKATQTLYPGTRLRISHSISRGYYCRLTGHTDRYPCDESGDIFVTQEVVDSLKQEMQRIIDADLPFKRHEGLTKDVVEIFERQGLSDKVLLLNTIHDLYTVYYELDGLCDSYYSTLAPRTGMLRVFDLRLHKSGMLLCGFDMKRPDVPPQHVTQEKMYKAFTDYIEFNNILEVRNVGELNRTVLNNKSSLLINVAEALHDKYLGRISDDISRRYAEGGARIVLIAGPSSSGKTTTTKRLAIQLITNLLRPQMLSLDNYFVDRHHTPRDEHGDYDYESLYALDLEQFNRDLNDILAGKEVKLPTYNFQTGTREYKGNTIKLGPNSILLIEGIHGLNPELTANIEEKMKYRIYVSALTTLAIDDHNWVPTADTRLLRRIIRDYKYRGASAVDTIHRWPSVRRGEEKWIFPYQENADATFNSSLLFELGVMKDYAEDILRHVPRDVPEYGEAYRLRKFLSYFLPIGESHIPSTSLLREFLGGSSFRY